MSLIKVNAKMQIVDLCGAVLGTLYRNEDERIAWRKNLLVGRSLSDSEVSIIEGIVEGWNNEH